MILVHILIVLFISCEYLNGQEFSCAKNFCEATVYSRGGCPKFSCKKEHQVTLRNSTDCGCCHRCVKELGEDEECIKEMTYNTPDTQCGPHLICELDQKKQKNFCRKISEVKEGCERTASELSKNPSKVTTGDPIPECDEDGYFAPTLCKNGTLCHCVDFNGTRIFGTDTYDKKDNMNCLCSRQFHEVNQKLKEYQIEPVNFMRCKANGNYEGFQMVTNFTYCINTTSGDILGKPVLKSNQDKLPCMSQKGDYVQETHCLKDYKEALKEIEKKQEKGYDLVVGYDVPNCDIDGSYKPVQCLNEHCYCVNKKGEKYREYQIERNDIRYAVNQTCSCVRELELIRTISKNKWDKVTDLFSHYICDLNGNYYPLQCTESVCYCVDVNTGFQHGASVLKTNKQDIRDKLLDECWRFYDLDHTYDDYYQDQY